MDRDSLQLLLAQGQSVEQIGRRFGRHPSTVSYWLHKHGLEAPNRAKHAPKGGIGRERLTELVGQEMTIAQIAEEVGLSKGAVRHWLGRYGLRTRHRGGRRPGGEGRVAERTASVPPRRVQATLVREAGGRCAICGYDRHAGALRFHQGHAGVKRANVGVRARAMSIEVLREEARNCVLLCSNCHAEVEGGVVALPLHLRERLSVAAHGSKAGRPMHHDPG